MSSCGDFQRRLVLASAFPSACLSCTLNGRGSISASRSPLLDHLPFGEADLHQFAVDAAVQRHRVQSGDRAQAVQVDIHVPLRGGAGHHRNDARGPFTSVAGAVAGSTFANNDFHVSSGT